MRASGVLLAVLLSALGARPARAADDGRLARLTAEYRDLARDQRWPSVKRRREVVREIAELDSPAAAPFLLWAFREDGEMAVRVPAMMGAGRRGTIRELRSLFSSAVRERNDVYVLFLPEALGGCGAAHAPEVARWLVEPLLLAADSTLRAAAARTLGALRAPSSAEAVRKVLAGDAADLLLHHECLLALARIDGPRSVPDSLPFLTHRRPELRAAAVDALALAGDPAAVPRGLTLAADPDPRVREAVADLVRTSGDHAHLPVLVGLLEDPRVRVAAKARDALRELTGQELGFDPGAWEAWIGKRQKKPPVRLPDTIGSVPTYHGMEILSDRVLFLVDASGSMNAGSPRRIEVARKELDQALGKLSRRALFNVAGFGGSPAWWSPRAKEATPAAVEDARRFVAGLSVGGETNLYDAVVSALGEDREADTIFLLGDGCPSAGKFREHEEILARLRLANRLRRVRIHCIALVDAPRPFPGPPAPPSRREEDEQEAAELLRRLAEENGGTFVRRES